MVDPYADRPQTKAKHFILEKYLQALTFKILQGTEKVLTYVDAFSGPWETRTEDFADSSFMIAIRVLRDALRQVRTKDPQREVRCFFVEQKTSSFKKLHAAVMAHHDPDHGFRIGTHQGKFEDAVQAILAFAGICRCWTTLNTGAPTCYLISTLTAGALPRSGFVHRPHVSPSAKVISLPKSDGRKARFGADRDKERRWAECPLSVLSHGKLPVPILREATI